MSANMRPRVVMYSSLVLLFDFILIRKNKVKSTGDIKGFGVLRYEDQAKIKQKIAEGGVASTGKGTHLNVQFAVFYFKIN